MSLVSVEVWSGSKAYKTAGNTATIKVTKAERKLLSKLEDRLYKNFEEDRARPYLVVKDLPQPCRKVQAKHDLANIATLPKFKFTPNTSVIVELDVTKIFTSDGQPWDITNKAIVLLQTHALVLINYCGSTSYLNLTTELKSAIHEYQRSNDITKPLKLQITCGEIQQILMIFDVNYKILT